MNLARAIAFAVIALTLTACTGAIPVVVRKSSSNAQSSGLPSQVQSPDAAAPRGKFAEQADGNGSQAEEPLPDDSAENPPQGAPLILAWMPMGDFPSTSAQLSAVSECTTSENVIRSSCQRSNALCKSTFQVTCDTSSDCRRLFKCTNGQNVGLIWFPMGDDVVKSATLSKICTQNANISGSACDSVNDRCLSGFCSSGSGDGCGRRLFKCLTSGETGKLFWRWVEDKPSTELSGTAVCPFEKDVAGQACSPMNDLCQSSFCATGDLPKCTKRRLFKCTP